MITTGALTPKNQQILSNTWGPPLSVLDRFLERVHIIKITGRSYRLRNITNGEMNIEEKKLEKKKSDN